MLIAPINSNQTHARYNKKSMQTQNFRGALSEAQYQNTLRKLKNVNKNVIAEFSPQKLLKVMERLGNKYKDLGIHSIGIQIISNSDLQNFLGDKAKNFDLRDKLGLCIAVGDRNAPVEQMNYIYEAETILATNSDLEKFNK